MFTETLREETICGARLGAGLCRARPMPGKRRCFAHGGAPRAGVVPPLDPVSANTVCGANLRGGGGTCSRVPVAGKKRCHWHGGSPRSGAPAGNINAVKHGHYAHFNGEIDKRRKRRARRMDESERNQVRKLQQVAGGLARGEPLSMTPEQVALASQFDGELLRSSLLQTKAVLKAEILASAQSRLDYSDAIPMHDVLSCLCNEASWFPSVEQLARGICAVFYFLDDGTWPLFRPGTDDAKAYYIGWRNFCAELLEQYCIPTFVKWEAGVTSP